MDFITAENLEMEIEKALNTTLSYNFAIDTDGSRFVETSGKGADVVPGYVDSKPHKLRASYQSARQKQKTAST